MYHHIKELMYTVDAGTPDPAFGNMQLQGVWMTIAVRRCDVRVVYPIVDNREYYED